MQGIVCVLLWLSASFLVGSSAVAAGPRELYERAASAIAANDLERAAATLEQLVSVHANSELSEVAAFHLAETLLLLDRSEDSIVTLRRWFSRIRDSSTAEQISPGIKARSTELLVKTLQALPTKPQALDCQLQILETRLEGDSSEFRCHVAADLSRRLRQLKDFEHAEKWLKVAIDECCDPALTKRLQTTLQLELPIAWAESEISESNPQAAIQRLQQALDCSPSVEQELSLRFLLAEAHYAAGNREQALLEFGWLTDQGERLEELPPWLAAVILRRAELLFRDRDVAQTRKLLIAAKKRFADFEFAYEFDYLLARCAIARIEFDEAVDCLLSVVRADSTQSKEPTARATWMLGEVYFLQRDYVRAIDAYYRVAAMDSHPDWQSRAWLQAAKCHELQGKRSDALADYARAAAVPGSAHISQEAASRMAAIKSTPDDLR